jgi:drug/metabolite transporter (DMT)-like permease
MGVEDTSSSSKRPDHNASSANPIVPSFILEFVNAFFAPRPQLRALVGFALPFLGLLLAFTLFSLYTVLMKSALNEGTSPLVLALLRELLAVGVLMPCAYLNEWRHTGTTLGFWPEESDFKSFLFLGLAMIWGVQLLSALSLEHLSANTYALLAPSVPVLTAAISIATGYEYFNRKSVTSWMKIGAVFIAVLGALWIAVGAYVNSNAKDKGNTVLGLILLATNKVCVATYPVMEKRLMKKYRAFTIVAWGYTSGAVLVFMSVIPCTLADSKLWHIGPAGWTSICFSAFITSAFNYALMAEINKVTSPLTVMSAYPWQSICTPLLSYLILKAPLSTSDGLGGFIICVGLFALAFARYKETQEVAESTLHEKLEEVPGTASNASSSSSTSAAAAASSSGTSTSSVTAETNSLGKGNVVEAVEDIHVRVNNTTNGEKESSTSDDPWAVRKETSTN